MSLSSDEGSSKRTRASGEVLDFLLSEFERNANPTPEQRRFISEKAGMNEKAVRIWFQNRRAKLRKFERMQKQSGHANIPPPPSMSSRSSSYRYSMGDVGMRMSNIPIEINEKYCFIDCSSLSVGSWQRIKTGYHDENLLTNNLNNLSPFTLNTIMNNVDLLVILSKKNFEINYFFSAISNNSKILFRVFYPISSIVTCSLLDNNINKENNELRVCLAHQPKFSVYFFNGVNSNSNQWSICDDFSEGQQVSQAYVQNNQTTIPHVLVGGKSSLQYLNSFILENNYPTAVGEQVSIPNELEEIPSLWEDKKYYPASHIHTTNNNSTSNSNVTSANNESPFSVNSGQYYSDDTPTSVRGPTYTNTTEPMIATSTAPTPDIFTSINEGSFNQPPHVLTFNNDNDSINSPNNTNSTTAVPPTHAYTHQNFHPNTLHNPNTNPSEFITDSLKLDLGEFDEGNNHSGSTEHGVDNFIDFGTNYP
ncbi:Regulatory protein PHO2 [Spathaspora sp. JA1]|nr:Regulatory protein PHO2 [Spathaspora sp. JA1]